MFFINSGRYCHWRLYWKFISCLLYTSDAAFGLAEPLILDLGILCITFGLTIKITVASIIGIVIGIIVYRMI